MRRPVPWSKSGARSNHARVGDRVTFDSTISCGQCDSCRTGQVNLCTKRRVLGVSCDEYRHHGAFAEFVAVPQNILYPLPSQLAFEHAALIEPVSVALHAVDLLKIKQGERAVVVGSGMIGLLVIQALRVAGCSEVIAIDIDAGRLQLASELARQTLSTRSKPTPSPQYWNALLGKVPMSPWKLLATPQLSTPRSVRFAAAAA